MNTATIAVSYRPVRLGLCIAEGALADLRRAVRLTSTLWGGRFNPVIPVGANTDAALELVRASEVDALLPVGDAPQVLAFAKSVDYLPWPTFPEGTLFVEGIGGSRPQFLDVRWPLRQIADRSRRETATVDPLTQVVVTVARGHAMDDALLCTAGGYPEGVECPLPYGEFVHRLLGSQYVPVDSSGAPAPGYWASLGMSAVAVTEYGLRVYGSELAYSGGVFIGDPASVADLLAFWNLRAKGAEVLFLPEHYCPEELAAANGWLTCLYERAAVAQQASREPGLWSARDQDWAKIREQIGTSCRVDAGGWLRARPPRVEFAGSSVVGVVEGSEGATSITIQLPPRPIPDEPEAWGQHLMVTAAPLVPHNPALGTFWCPPVPALNPFYGRCAYFDPRAARVGRDGLAVAIGADRSNLTLRAVPTRDLTTAVLRLGGITASPSTAGKVAARIIQHMGGLDSCRVFKIPGVRKLLQRFANGRAFSRHEAMGQLGPGFGPHKRLFIEQRDHPELTPEDVFSHLLGRRVIRPGQELACGVCELSAWYALAELDESILCKFCGARFDCGCQLQDRRWHYRISGIFARTADHEGSLPVILALMQLLRLSGTGHWAWQTGTDLRWNDNGTEVRCEADLIVLMRGRDATPELVLGECKTSGNLGGGQVERLVAAASRFADSGVTPYLLFAKAGANFADEELALLARLLPAGLGCILFTPTELEPYEPSGSLYGTPQGAPGDLPGWARHGRSTYLAK